MIVHPGSSLDWTVQLIWKDGRSTYWSMLQRSNLPIPDQYQPLASQIQGARRGCLTASGHDRNEPQVDLSSSTASNESATLATEDSKPAQNFSFPKPLDNQLALTAARGPELVRSSSKTLELDRDLLVAAFAADVHPRVLTAVEAIGQKFFLDASLRNKAERCLGRNASVRIGGACWIKHALDPLLSELFKVSQGLLTFFLIATHLRLHLDLVDIAEIFYEWHLSLTSNAAGLKNPVSSTQIHTLIKRISGHCEDFICEHQLVQTLNPLFTFIGRYSQFKNDCPLFRPMEAGISNRIVVQVVEKLHSMDPVSGITITGGPGGLWIASLFQWLYCTMMDFASL
jgi:hypothetical protein